ncbi:MAG: hypothetical protein ACM31G_07140 [Flavobacteriales bacterium]
MARTYITIVSSSYSNEFKQELERYLNDERQTYNIISPMTTTLTKEGRINFSVLLSHTVNTNP